MRQYPNPKKKTGIGYRVFPVFSAQKFFSAPEKYPKTPITRNQKTIPEKKNGYFFGVGGSNPPYSIFPFSSFFLYFFLFFLFFPLFFPFFFLFFPLFFPFSGGYSRKTTPMRRDERGGTVAKPREWTRAKWFRKKKARDTLNFLNSIITSGAKPRDSIFAARNNRVEITQLKASFHVNPIAF